MILKGYLESLGLSTTITCDICNKDLLVEDIVISFDPNHPMFTIFHHGFCTPKDMPSRIVVIPSIEFQRVMSDTWGGVVSKQI